MATWAALFGAFFDLGVEAWTAWADEHAVFLGLVAVTLIGVPQPAAAHRQRPTIAAWRRRATSAVRV